MFAPGQRARADHDVVALVQLLQEPRQLLDGRGEVGVGHEPALRRGPRASRAARRGPCRGCGRCAGRWPPPPAPSPRCRRCEPSSTTRISWPRPNSRRNAPMRARVRGSRSASLKAGITTDRNDLAHGPAGSRSWRAAPTPGGSAGQAEVAGRPAHLLQGVGEQAPLPRALGGQGHERAVLARQRPRAGSASRRSTVARRSWCAAHVFARRAPDALAQVGRGQEGLEQRVRAPPPRAGRDRRAPPRRRGTPRRGGRARRDERGPPDAQRPHQGAGHLAVARESAGPAPRPRRTGGARSPRGRGARSGAGASSSPAARAHARSGSPGSTSPATTSRSEGWLRRSAAAARMATSSRLAAVARPGAVISSASSGRPSARRASARDGSGSRGSDRWCGKVEDGPPGQAPRRPRRDVAGEGDHGQAPFEDPVVQRERARAGSRPPRPARDLPRHERPRARRARGASRAGRRRRRPSPRSRPAPGGAGSSRGGRPRPGLRRAARYDVGVGRRSCRGGRRPGPRRCPPSPR